MIPVMATFTAVCCGVLLPQYESTVAVAFTTRYLGGTRRARTETKNMEPLGKISDVDASWL